MSNTSDGCANVNANELIGKADSVSSLFFKLNLFLNQVPNLKKKNKKQKAQT